MVMWMAMICDWNPFASDAGDDLLAIVSRPTSLYTVASSLPAVATLFDCSVIALWFLYDYDQLQIESNAQRVHQA